MRTNPYTKLKPLPINPKVWTNSECTWVSIPKNANMMMRGLCEKSGMKACIIDTAQNLNSTETIVIIRNPRTRLLSGLLEYRKRNSIAKNKRINSLLEMLLDDITIFDEHLEPQHFYMQNFTFTHILKFENLKQELSETKFFEKNINYVNSMVDESFLHKSRKIGKQEFDNHLAKNKELIDQCIKKYYSVDQDIWDNTRKYINTHIPAQEKLK